MTILLQMITEAYLKEQANFKKRHLVEQNLDSIMPDNSSFLLTASVVPASSQTTFALL